MKRSLSPFQAHLSQNVIWQVLSPIGYVSFDMSISDDVSVHITIP